jgi:hypothetical protein
MEARERQLLIQAFHTFPDDYSIVKSVSVFSIDPQSPGQASPGQASPGQASPGQASPEQA